GRPPRRLPSSTRASVSIQPLSTLAAERTVVPPSTTPGKVIPTGPVQPKWSTTCLTPSATASGVAGCGVRTLWRSCARSPLPRSTGAPLIPDPPMSTPKISMAPRYSSWPVVPCHSSRPAAGPSLGRFGGGAGAAPLGHQCGGLLAQVAAQFLGQGEDDGLLGGPDDLDVLEAALRQPLQDLLDQHLRDGGARGEADRGDALQPALVDLGGEVHQVGVTGARLQGDLDEALGVGGVAGADDDHQVGVRAHLLDRELAVLRGVADVVAGRGDELGELVLEGVDGLHRLVDGERGLGEPDDLGGVADLDLGDVLGAVDQLDVVGGLAGGADDLLVALVPDQEDVVVLLGEAD